MDKGYKEQVDIVVLAEGDRDEWYKVDMMVEDVELVFVLLVVLQNLGKLETL